MNVMFKNLQGIVISYLKKVKCRTINSGMIVIYIMHDYYALFEVGLRCKYTDSYKQLNIFKYLSVNICTTSILLLTRELNV